MASTRSIARALEYTAIGANLYVFTRWNAFRVPTEARRDDGTVDTTSRAYLAAYYRHQRYMLDHYTISQRNIDEGRWHTLLTSAFSHRSLSHLAVNMVMIHQATSIAMHVGLGPLRLGALALGAALGGSLGSLYDNAQRSNVVDGGEEGGGRPPPPPPLQQQRAARPNDDMPGLGASGMVQGMLVATMLAVPALPIHAFFIPVPIAYRTFVGAFLAWDMWNLYEERTQGARKLGWTGSYVGYAAHLGGAAFGTVFYLVAMRRGRPMRLKKR